jgi:cyclopropane fatty-acyl-phospholipid synthase-like methyltransferase
MRFTLTDTLWWALPTSVISQDEAKYTIEFPPDCFDAVVSFYTLEHIPRQEHKTVLRRIYKWLRDGGFLLLSIEAADFDDVISEYWACRCSSYLQNAF